MGNKEVKFQAGQEILSGLYCVEEERQQVDIVFLHGAGHANKDILRPLASALLTKGLASFCFDFSGHGQSSGKLHNSSLSKRVEEALAALNLCNEQDSITLCAFSMGGHVALELLGTGLVRNLILFAPAIYTQEAFNVSFDSNFTRIIRQPNSWSQATVVDKLDLFKGKILIVYGDHDEVIPKGVLTMLESHSENAERKETLIISNCGHQLLPCIYKDRDLFETIVLKMVDFATVL